MAKITYLIGAGASVGTIPLISGFADGIKYLGEEMSKHESSLMNRYPGSQRDFYQGSYQRLLKDCSSFEQMSRDQNSVDSLAFKLFHIGKYSELERLKAIISSVIIFSTFKNPVNLRYDNFFTKTLTNITNQFKNDIRVISWNYDYLFEKAYSNYSERQTISENQSLLNVNPDNVIIDPTRESFQLFKINGTTSFHSSSPGIKINIWNNFENKNLAELLSSILDIYSTSTWGRTEYVSDISFAFENKFKITEGHILKKAIEEIQGSKALILIGYSFPHINKEYDRQILDALFANVQKVFIQSAEDKGVIMEKIISIHDKYYEGMFTHKPTSEFYVPYESF